MYFMDTPHALLPGLVSTEMYIVYYCNLKHKFTLIILFVNNQIWLPTMLVLFCYDYKVLSKSL